MSAPLSHEADANQARASDPNASAWVSANAGTGKTAVLVQARACGSCSQERGLNAFCA